MVEENSRSQKENKAPPYNTHFLLTFLGFPAKSCENALS